MEYIEWAFEASHWAGSCESVLGQLQQEVEHVVMTAKQDSRYRRHNDCICDFSEELQVLNLDRLGINYLSDCKPRKCFMCRQKIVQRIITRYTREPLHQIYFGCLRYMLLIVCDSFVPERHMIQEIVSAQAQNETTSL